MCRLKEGAASMLALVGLQQLQDLELVQVFGFGLTEVNPRALEEAIEGLTNLRRLHVSAPPACVCGLGSNRVGSLRRTSDPQRSAARLPAKDPPHVHAFSSLQCAG
jgi:hypothetical protein